MNQSIKLTVEQANKLFIYLFKYRDKFSHCQSAMASLDILGLNINDIIEAVNFDKLSGRGDNAAGYEWLHTPIEANCDGEIRHTFLKSYFKNLNFMAGSNPLNEKNLLKILSHTKIEDLEDLLTTFIIWSETGSKIDSILPQAFLEKILKITNYSFIPHHSIQGSIKSFLNTYTKGLSLQEPVNTNYAGFKCERLLNAQQLKIVIEKSEVFNLDTSNLSIPANLMSRDASHWGPIALDMEDNLELIFKKVNVKDYPLMIDGMLANLCNLNGLKILDKMSEFLKIDWLDYLIPKHISFFELDIILNIYNRNHIKAKEVIKSAADYLEDYEFKDLLLEIDIKNDQNLISNNIDCVNKTRTTQLKI